MFPVATVVRRAPLLTPSGRASVGPEMPPQSLEKARFAPAIGPKRRRLRGPRHSVPKILLNRLLSRCAGWPPAFGIGAGGTGALLTTGTGAGAARTEAGGAGLGGAFAETGASPPRPPGGGAGACAPVRSSGGSSGGNGFGASGLRQTPSGRPATGTPSCAAFMNRLQISTGRLPPETFFVGLLSSLPSHTAATR